MSKLLNMEHKEFNSMAPDDLAGLLIHHILLCTLPFRDLEVPSTPQTHSEFSLLFASVVYPDNPHILLLIHFG